MEIRVAHAWQSRLAIAPRSSVDHFAPVRMQHLAGHVVRIRRSQKNVARRDLHRLSGRFRGTSVPKSATLSGGKVEGINGVHMGPGATAFTRIPFSATALASERVN